MFNKFIIAQSRPATLSLVLSLLLVVSGCAGTPESESGKADSVESVETEQGDSEFEDDTFAEELDFASEVDPWETMNRGIFAFNDTLDQWVLLPVSKGYQWVTPDPMETGVSNAYANLFEITNIFNSLLQLKFVDACASTGRFLVNSTLGLFGFIDVASDLGLEKRNEDFGQTLGYWGAPSGPYIVVPFFGSRTIRSGVGSLGDMVTDPLWGVSDNTTRWGLVGLRWVSDRASLIQAEELITGDRYTFIRDAYLQRREFLVNDGVVEDDFGEEDEDWDSEWEEEWE